MNFPSVISIRRVINRSECSATQFYQGLILRSVERCFESMPMFIGFSWLYSIKTGQPYAPLGWLNSLELGLVEPRNEAVFYTVLLLLVFICQLTLAYLGQRQSFLGSYHIIQGYRERLIDRARQLPLGTLYRYRAGQLAEMLTQDIKRIESIFTHVAADLFSATATPVIWLLFLFFLDWQLSLSLLAGLPLAVMVLHQTRLFFGRASAEKQTLHRNTAGQITEFCLGIKTLRLFNQTQKWLTRLQACFSQLKEKSIGVEAWGAGPVVGYRFVLETSVMALLIVMSIRAQANNALALDTAEWVLFLLLAFKIIAPLLEAAEHLTLLRFALQSENKLEQLFNQPLMPEPPYPARPEGFDISFNNVSFAYEQTDVLRNIRFTVPQHSVTAIVGSSGAGKSSLINLAARLYQPDSGDITIGGQDIASIGTTQLYQLISVVFQQAQLCDGTVMQNLRAARPTASDDQVVAVCQAANCDSFIRALPQGYQTRIGEGGTYLSGGERQRLCIARGLLKNAPVLLLDEVTSAVDPQNQFYIQQGLNQLIHDKTVIVIAHRLSTVVSADQILVMDQGEVVQRGTHEQLIRQQGLYSQLWHAQQNGFSERQAL